MIRRRKHVTGRSGPALLAGSPVRLGEDEPPFRHKAIDRAGSAVAAQSCSRFEFSSGAPEVSVVIRPISANARATSFSSAPRSSVAQTASRNRFRSTLAGPAAPRLLVLGFPGFWFAPPPWGFLCRHQPDCLFAALALLAARLIRSMCAFISESTRRSRSAASNATVRVDFTLELRPETSPRRSRCGLPVASCSHRVFAARSGLRWIALRGLHRCLLVAWHADSVAERPLWRSLWVWKSTRSPLS